MDACHLEALRGCARIRVVHGLEGTEIKCRYRLLTAESNLHSAWNTELTVENHMDNMQNFELHSFTTEIIWTQTAVNAWLCVGCSYFNREINFSPVVSYAIVFSSMQTEQRCKLSFSPSLHGLVQVSPFIGAKRVEGGHNKLPIKGAARQQPLSLFGVTGVGVLYKHLLDTHRTCGWVIGWMTGCVHYPGCPLCVAVDTFQTWSIFKQYVFQQPHFKQGTYVCISFFWKCVY